MIQARPCEEAANDSTPSDGDGTALRLDSQIAPFAMEIDRRVCLSGECGIADEMEMPGVGKSIKLAKSMWCDRNCDVGASPIKLIQLNDLAVLALDIRTTKLATIGRKESEDEGAVTGGVADGLCGGTAPTFEHGGQFLDCRCPVLIQDVRATTKNAGSATRFTGRNVCSLGATCRVRCLSSTGPA